jgi:hypothetical protein
MGKVFTSDIDALLQLLALKKLLLTSVFPRSIERSSTKLKLPDSADL